MVTGCLENYLWILNKYLANHRESCYDDLPQLNEDNVSDNRHTWDNNGSCKCTSKSELLLTLP